MITTMYRSRRDVEREEQRELPYSGHFEAEADSALDLLDAEPASDSERRRMEYMLSHYEGPHWYDFAATGAEIVQAVRAGDSRFFDPLVSKIAQLKPPHNETAIWRQTKRRRIRVRGDIGNELDIHEARQGRIDRAWTRTKFEPREHHDSRQVNLVINCSLNASVSAEDSQWRTAAAIAIYDELVRLGKSVAIYMVRTSANVFEGQIDVINTLMVPVKRLGDQMSQYHVAAYCSPSFTRAVMMYRYSHLVPGMSARRNYGMAQNVQVLTRSLREMRRRGMFVIYLPHCFSLREARLAVENVVRQAAGKAA